MLPPFSHPLLASASARQWEEKLFQGDEGLEWEAMQRAGRAAAAAVLEDFREIGGFPNDGRILVLVGKGGNAGDALIAAQAILGRFPSARADILFALGERALGPAARRAWRDLAQAAPQRAEPVAEEAIAPAYALALDGLFGFSFRPPLAPAIVRLLETVESRAIGLRAAIDLPSGLGADGAGPCFRADFTYATGIVKRAAVAPAAARWVGRLRYLDLGFFDAGRPDSDGPEILLPSVLAPLRALRPPDSDKRTYGHLFVLGGSRGTPGALLMAVLSALRSGAGLVTAFAPESLVPSFAARAPEAMWVAWPETPEGSLALAGRNELRARWPRATALAIGPGLGREPETLALAAEVVAESPVPLVIDADALQPNVVRGGGAARILTPHAGELRRIAVDEAFFAPGHLSGEAVVVAKGRLTSLRRRGGGSYFSLFGGPVLARGGSGDVLTGLIGGQLARQPAEPLLAAAQGVVWHGLAADCLARAQGQHSAMATQILDHLSEALRSC